VDFALYPILLLLGSALVWIARLLASAMFLYPLESRYPAIAALGSNVIEFIVFFTSEFVVKTPQLTSTPQALTSIIHMIGKTVAYVKIFK
jgi:hypothetical protein